MRSRDNDRAETSKPQTGGAAERHLGIGARQGPYDRVCHGGSIPLRLADGGPTIQTILRDTVAPDPFVSCNQDSNPAGNLGAMTALCQGSGSSRPNNVNRPLVTTLQKITQRKTEDCQGEFS